MVLSENQQKIIDSDSKYISVNAGAGSGKTRVIVEKIKKVIKYLPDNTKILAVTFSNKATDELKDRLTNTFSLDEINDHMYIGTIHNFCNTILMNYGHLINVTHETMIISNRDDLLNLLASVIQEEPSYRLKFSRLNASDARKEINSLLSNIAKEKRRLLFPFDPSESKPFNSLMSLLEAKMMSQNLIDYDDLICLAYRLLNQYPGILNIYRNMFSHIFVDEAQDINKAQYELIKLIAGDTCSILMVGDRQQAIYGFSGGSYYYFINQFPQDFPVEKFSLKENFRSARSIVEAANKIENQSPSNAVYPINGEFKIVGYRTEEEEAKAIVTSILSLMENGNPNLDEKPKLSDFAVLARNRYVFHCLEEELKKQNLFYSLKVSPRGTFSSESNYMKLFELLLMLKENPKNNLYIAKINELLGLPGNRTFDEIVKDDTLDQNSKVMCRYLKEAIDSIDDEDVDLPRCIDILSKMTEDKEYFFSKDEEKQMILNDLNLWRNNWQLYIKNSQLGNRNFDNFIHTMPLLSFSPEQPDSITLSTIHMSKGLEYPIVYIMGLEDGTFPDYRAIAKGQEQLEEEKHELFVAITRAKRLCYLTYATMKVMPWGSNEGQYRSRLLDALGKDEKSL